MRSVLREPSMKRALIIEDDRDIVELVRYNLANEGFQVNAAFDGTSGLPLAAIDGAAITLWKTAANSALAATYLARKDARTLLMVGAGALAPYLARAHCAPPTRQRKPIAAGL